MSVEKEEVDLKVPVDWNATEPYVIDEDNLKRKTVYLNIFKGNCIAEPEYYHLGKYIMLRTRISFEGNLKYYLPMPDIVAKDVVESLDIEMGIIEFFLRRHYNKWQIIKKLSPVRERYFSTEQVGQYIGRITLNFQEFRDFTKFIEFLAYEPIRNENAL